MCSRQPRGWLALLGRDRAGSRARFDGSPVPCSQPGPGASRRSRCLARSGDAWAAAARSRGRRLVPPDRRRGDGPGGVVRGRRACTNARAPDRAQADRSPGRARRGRRDRTRTQQQRIFERLYRVHSTRDRATGESGLRGRDRPSRGPELDGHVELEALGKPASSASSSLGRCALAPHRVPDQPLAAPSEVARSTRGRTPTRCWGFSQPEMGRFTHTEPAMPVRRYEHRQRSTRELKSMPVVTQRCLWRRPLAVVGESARRRPRLKTRRM